MTINHLGSWESIRMRIYYELCSESRILRGDEAVIQSDWFSVKRHPVFRPCGDQTLGSAGGAESPTKQTVTPFAQTTRSGWAAVIHIQHADSMVASAAVQHLASRASQAHAQSHHKKTSENCLSQKKQNDSLPKILTTAYVLRLLILLTPQTTRF